MSIIASFGRAALCAAGIAVSAVSPSSAQSGFPQKDITFIVPWNAGGSNDVAARALDPILREHGIKLVIENVPGATGVIGMKRVASSAPDGYVIGMGTSSTLALIAQNKASGLTNANFTHIARVSTDPLMLLVPSTSAIKSLSDYIANMKSRPGKVTIGTPGSYNLNHIFASMTARAAGVEYVNVPYTGGSKVVADLIGQHVDSGVLKPSETLGQIQEKLLTPIGIFANERLEMFPEVPTFKERGFDVFPYGPVVQMAYVVGPAELPNDVRTKLVTAFRAAIQDPRFKEFAKKNVFLVDDLTGDALTKEVDSVAVAIGKVAAQTFPKE
ncbi:tripartite tricarboxylate transporter substrate binding protein [Rhodopseudomonas boonkerdii]|uniref:Bug family tripartite tricarboxylate transporter substrate binding protein n=1 Tax=Rhodopseudomonas boonkerdii TaxID=475937 RepID=UPI001E55A03B|nr:tripartite tricarboxylate transporter substrate binding protein [Rhodopseudomonas boonkerdii]UGV26688.1 tripartite tricarboxylate transporter substrate binding protein [Rhodopseudomonas boonkerdii]